MVLKGPFEMFSVPLSPIFGCFLWPCICTSPSSLINSGLCSCGSHWLLWLEIRYIRKRFSPFHSDLPRTQIQTHTESQKDPHTHKPLAHIQCNCFSKKKGFSSRGRMCSHLFSASGFPLVPANTSDLKASYLLAGLALDALFLSGLW